MTDGRGDDFGSLALILIVAVPGTLLLLSLLPEHATRAAGAVGRLVVESRVVFAALALAIWLGVVVSVFFGGWSG